MPTVIFLPAEEKCTMKELLTENPLSSAVTEEMSRNELNELHKSNLIKAAKELGYTRKRLTRVSKSKPWFDNECKIAMNHLRSTLDNTKRSSAPMFDRIEELKQARRSYKSTHGGTQRKKKECYEGIQNTINTSSNPIEF